jgi:hypothetical protein
MVLNLDKVQKEIESWIENFVEVPHPSLGGWAPCPYARKARLDRDYEVCLGLAPIHDLIKISQHGLNNKSVIIIVYDPNDYTHEEFSRELTTANREFLLEKDLLALEDHPGDPEIVNGVCMNQGTYALALVQSLSDLDQKAQVMANKGFYQTWPEEYLQALFRHRKDPRA